MLKLNENLYFLHIPKTAGTSLSAWLSSHFKSTEICPFLDLSSLRSTPEKLRNYRYFTGHWGMKLLDLIERPRIVTWLRDPARRMLSSYTYLRDLDVEMQSLLNDPFAIKQHQAAQGLSFAEWVLLPQDEYAHNEVMTQCLYPQDLWDEEVLSDTIRNLNRLDHVGLVDRMQDSVDLLCHKFIWLPTRFGLRLNTSRSSSTQIDARTLAAIRERNPWDYALYEHGKQLFEERWQTMLKSLDLAPARRPWARKSAAPPPAGSDELREELHRHLTRRYRRYRSPLQQVDYIVVLQGERDRLDAELNAAQKEAQLVDATVSEQTNHINLLEAERDRLTAETKALQTEANRASEDGQRHIDALTKQLVRQSAEGQGHIDGLRTQLDQLAATSREQSTYVATLEKERDRLSAEVGELRQKDVNYLAVTKEQSDYIRILEAVRDQNSGKNDHIVKRR